MKKRLISAVIILILIIYSCNKKQDGKNFFKETNYKIAEILYKKNYENAIKYIDSVFFSKENLLNETQKSYLLFKEAEIKYLYLNNTIDSYREMKKLFKNNKLDKKDYIRLLKYLTEISELSDYQNYGVFLKKLVNTCPDKEILYRYISFLKKERKITELKKLIKNNNILSEDEIILLNLDLMILKNESKDKILKFIDSGIERIKNNKTIDDLKIRKIFYLEKSDKVDYKELLKILDTIKSPKYKTLIKNKKIFYNKKISLYNKK